MNLGRPTDPAWALNLTANPRATLVVRNRHIEVEARRCTGPEARERWARWVELQPSASAFQALVKRDIPMFVVTPVSTR
jgi:deazaflavin-dependent oxidoreductase (nitroreductase family)